MYKEACVAFALDKRAGDETSDVYNHVLHSHWINERAMKRATFTIMSLLTNGGWTTWNTHKKEKNKMEHSKAESLFTNDSAAPYTP
jgi:hypothetical protein